MSVMIKPRAHSNCTVLYALPLVALLSMPLSACFSNEPSAEDIKKAYTPAVKSYIGGSRPPRTTVEQALSTFKLVGCKENQGRVGQTCTFTIALEPNQPNTYTLSFLKVDGVWKLD